jgi:hypothetical protein
MAIDLRKGQADERPALTATVPGGIPRETPQPFNQLTPQKQVPGVRK